MAKYVYARTRAPMRPLSQRPAATPEAASVACGSAHRGAYLRRMASFPPAANAPDSAARRRLRVWIVLASISIGWKVLVFTLGAAIPRWVIDDGIGALPVASRLYAAEARHTAMALWNGPIERHGFVRMVRVMSVDTVPHELLAAAGVAAGRCESGRLGARVRAYTYFAIPYSEVRTVCDTGHVEYRVFRRRARKPE